jgi:hypothetical protein
MYLRCVDDPLRCLHHSRIQNNLSDVEQEEEEKKQLLASLCGAFFSWLRFGMDNVMWISSSVSVTWTGLTMLLSRAFSSHGLSKAKEK